MSMCQFLEHAGTGLRYRLEGQAGPPLVLVHEMGGALESFDPFVPLIPGRRILRFDMRGFGMASKVAGSNDLDAMAGDLAGLLDALGIAGPVDLAGMAVGAALAMRFATRHPARVGALALAGPALGVAAERRAPILARAGRIEAEGIAAMADEELTLTYPAPLREPGAFSAYRARWLGNDPASYAATYRMLATLDMHEDLARLGAPALFLADTLDPLRPPAMIEAFARKVPGARFVTLESGHVPAWQSPASFAAALTAFLASVSGEPKP